MASSKNNNGAGQEQFIKSKERVRDLAEVYTAEREVRAMLDLVPGFSLKQTFLEPACGNGNFLIEILRRKLQSHPTTRAYFERGADGQLTPFTKKGRAEKVVTSAIEAVSTIYGIDICFNNIAETQARLYAYVVYGEDLLLPGFLTGADPHTLSYLEAVAPGHALPLAPDYREHLFLFADKAARIRNTHERAASVSPLLRDTLKLVLAKNFQQGDFLAQRDAKGQPLTVGKWEFHTRLNGETTVRREDFFLSDVGTKNPQPVSVLSVRSLTAFVKGSGHA